VPVYTNCPECTAKDFTYLLMGDSGEVECKQTGSVYNSDKIVNNAEIPVQSVLTYNFHGTHRSGTLHGHLRDSSVFLFIWGSPFRSDANLHLFLFDCRR